MIVGASVPARGLMVFVLCLADCAQAWKIILALPVSGEINYQYSA
jgi:hypothetical protein